MSVARCTWTLSDLHDDGWPFTKCLPEPVIINDEQHQLKDLWGTRGGESTTRPAPGACGTTLKPRVYNNIISPLLSTSKNKSTQSTQYNLFRLTSPGFLNTLTFIDYYFTACNRFLFPSSPTLRLYATRKHLVIGKDQKSQLFKYHPLLIKTHAIFRLSKFLEVVCP